jgi:hypothetical protein
MAIDGGVRQCGVHDLALHRGAPRSGIAREATAGEGAQAMAAPKVFHRVRDPAVAV